VDEKGFKMGSVSCGRAVGSKGEGGDGSAFALYVLGLKASVLPTSIWRSQMCK
jgi:hypothetical protein